MATERNRTTSKLHDLLGSAKDRLEIETVDKIPLVGSDSHIEPRRLQMIRYDPRDLSRVFLKTPSDYIAADPAGGPAMAFSLREWREVRASALHAGRSWDPHRIAEELAANRSLIREKVSHHRRGSARRLAREAQWIIDPNSASPNSHFLKTRVLTHAARCRVDGDDR